MEVEIISKDYIKPSSPTPHHLRVHKLSLLDQFIPSIHVPMVLYYPLHDHPPVQKDAFPIEKKLQLLKHSFSQTLTRYYPLAGKIKDSLSVDCNDEGTYYVEARIKCNLSEFLRDPDLSLIHHFLPIDPSWNESAVGAAVAMVQVSVFDCGGITIGVFVWHKVGDGLSISNLLKDWGATTRGCRIDIAVSPDFRTSPTLFPQNDSFPKESSMMAMFYPFLKTGKAVTRRFVFHAPALAELRTKSTSSRVQHPTRIEAVSALIWKCTMAAFKANSGVQKPSLLSHAVNLRRRAVPQLPEYIMGNLVGIAAAQCTAETETETELCHLVHELREAITKIDGQFMKKLEGDPGFYNFCEALKHMGGVFSSAASTGAEYLSFSSWCNFGIYDVDFGWGKPMWATSSGPREEETVVFMNFIGMMENNLGDGIEAWVTLDEQDMAILECDRELLAFASMNPSPLQVGKLMSLI